MDRPQFSPQQRSFLVREYHRTNSVAAVLERFREVYPRERCPSRATVYNNVIKYTEMGTSQNRNQGNSGRGRMGRSPANIQEVQNALQNHPAGGVSCRRNGLGLSSSTFNRITRLDLQFHPYQMIKRQQLLPGDRERRLAFCQWKEN